MISPLYNSAKGVLNPIIETRADTNPKKEYSSNKLIKYPIMIKTPAFHIVMIANFKNAMF